MNIIVGQELVSCRLPLVTGRAAGHEALPYAFLFARYHPYISGKCFAGSW